MLILVSGLPGTGKTTISDGIARDRRAPVLSVDPIESAILRAGIAPSFEAGLAAYLVAEALADVQLAAGLDVVVDAVNSVEVARDWWRALASKHGVPLRIIVCIMSDRAEHQRRLASRVRGLAMPETTWEQVESRRGEWRDWPEPHATLDGVESIAANFAKSLDFLSERRHHQDIGTLRP